MSTLVRRALAAAAVVLAGHGVAGAQGKKQEADELFRKAKKLLADKRYAEACPKFEASYKLDPGIGGELNIGRCYEEWGKLGRAYRAYIDAEAQAKAANDAREEKIHGLVSALGPQVPRLVIRVPAGADTSALDLRIDGVRVAATELANPQLVDPGPKEVAYLSAGAKRTKTIAVERGQSSEITLDLPKPAPAVEEVSTGGDATDDGSRPHRRHKPASSDDAVAGQAPSVGRGQRIGGIVLGMTGVVAVGVGVGVAFSARSKYNTALAADCMGMTDACDPQGLTDTHEARSEANIATIVVGVGVAAIAGGAVLYFLAPHAATGEHAFYVAPTGGPGTAGLAFGGRL